MEAGAWAKARLGQAKASTCLAWDFEKPEPSQARPKPGLSGQAGAGKSLVVIIFNTSHGNFLKDKASTVLLQPYVQGYYGWHHMFIWLGVQIEILRMTEHNICSSGAVMSLGAKLDIFTHFEAQFGQCSIVVMTDDKTPIGSVQRVIWWVTEPKVVIVQYTSKFLSYYSLSL